MQLKYMPAGFQVVANAKAVVIRGAAVFIDAMAILKRNGLAFRKLIARYNTGNKAIVFVKHTFHKIHMYHRGRELQGKALVEFPSDHNLVAIRKPVRYVLVFIFAVNGHML